MIPFATHGPACGNFPKTRAQPACPRSLFYLAAAVANHNQIADGLEQFRSYLRLLAPMQIGPKLRPKVDASDIVQQTMLQAVKGKDDCRGTTEPPSAA